MAHYALTTPKWQCLKTVVENWPEYMAKYRILRNIAHEIEFKHKYILQTDM